MDLDKEWVILPDDGGKQISSRKYGLGGDPTIVFHKDYFMCPSPNSQTIPKNPRVENPIFPVQVELENVKEIQKVPIELVVVENEKVKENMGDVWETDHKSDRQTDSQVLFNNMKIDSPKELHSMIGSKMRMEGENFDERNRLESDSEEKITWGGKNGGLNIWKWGLSGVGAICSFGVAAATICIVIFGNGIHQRNKQQNQRLRFRIYANEKVRT